MDEIPLNKDQWLSEMFGHDVLRLALNGPRDEDDFDLCKDIRQHLERRPIFIYTKISVDAIRYIHGLEKVGFRLVDTSIIFEKKIVTDRTFCASTAIRFARGEDKAEVERIALRNFLYSRFHLDPKIPDEIANTVKANWATNFFTGTRGDAMVVSEHEGRLAGFLQLLYHGANITIDLIAVDQMYRRNHIASDMIDFAQRNLNGAKSIRVGTQVANLPSMALYEKTGFMIADAAYVFHYHNR